MRPFTMMSMHDLRHSVQGIRTTDGDPSPRIQHRSVCALDCRSGARNMDLRLPPVAADEPIAKHGSRLPAVTTDPESAEPRAVR